MRRLALVGAGLVLPLLPAAPAFAADNIICVTGVTAGTSCDQTVATILDALAAATGNGLPDTILLGPVSYPSGPLNLNGAGQLTLKGSGPATVLTMSGTVNPDTFLSVTNGATVRDLTVQMPTASSTGDFGIVATSSTVQEVSIDATAVASATGIKAQGSTILDSSVQMSLTNTVAFASRGNNVVTNVALTGHQGYAYSGTVVDNASRARIVTDGTGVTLDSGTINLDDAVIDVGASGTGLDAANYNNNPGSIVVNADHLTIVGGAGAQGVHAFVGGSASQQSTVDLDSSIVQGPATSLLADASGSTGSGVPSAATINVSYSDWQLGTAMNGGTGTAQVHQLTGNVKVDPGFVSPGAGDYHLGANSVLLDLGDPAAGGPAVDLDGHARVTDGDGNGTAVRDMGAYERPAAAPVGVPDTTAPQTTITAKPHKRLTKQKARFAFVSSETGSTFVCKLDKKAWRACTSPVAYRVKVGKHHFWVRATDFAGNPDATPAPFTFKRVR